MITVKNRISVPITSSLSSCKNLWSQTNVYSSNSNLQSTQNNFPHFIKRFWFLRFFFQGVLKSTNDGNFPVNLTFITPGPKTYSNRIINWGQSHQLKTEKRKILLLCFLSPFFYLFLFVNRINGPSFFPATLPGLHLNFTSAWTMWRGFSTETTTPCTFPPQPTARGGATQQRHLVSVFRQHHQAGHERILKSLKDLEELSTKKHLVIYFVMYFRDNDLNYFIFLLFWTWSFSWRGSFLSSNAKMDSWWFFSTLTIQRKLMLVAVKLWNWSEANNLQSQRNAERTSSAEKSNGSWI